MLVNYEHEACPGPWLMYLVILHLTKLIFPVPEVPIAKCSLDKHGVVRVPFFLSAEISSGLNLFRSGACCHRLCKLTGASILSGLEDIVPSGSSSPLYSSDLSALSFTSVSEPLEEALSTPKTLPPCTPSSCGSLYELPSTAKRNSCYEG